MILVLATSLGISSASAQTGITVGTNFDSFGLGQVVMITGNADGSSAGIQVKDPNGLTIVFRTVTTDSNGNFELKLRIPQTAVLGDWIVVATTAVDNVPVIGTATFEVVGESDKTIQTEQPREALTQQRTPD